MPSKYIFRIGFGITLVIIVLLSVWGLAKYTSSEYSQINSGPKTTASASTDKNLRTNKIADYPDEDLLPIFSSYYYYSHPWSQATGKFADIIDGKKIDGIETKNLNNGDILVKEGPELINYMSPTGECGSCNKIFLGIYQIRPSQNTVRTIFNYEDPDEGYDTDAPNPTSMQDIIVSSNWDSISIYKKSGSLSGWENPIWYFRKYCQVNNKDNQQGELGFRVCDSKSDVPEPQPRTFIYEEHLILTKTSLIN
ncbi:MAG: hypothetical protein WC791_00870 [Candidatus Paceibacterota bacterium]|jgi:hypothetical protein